MGATQLLPKFEVSFGRRLLGLPLIALGAVVALSSYRHWRANERAMRRGEPLTRSRSPQVLAIGIAVLAAVAVLLRRVWPLDRSGHVLALFRVTAGAGAWSLGLPAARSLARTTHHGRELPEAATLRWVTTGTVTLALAAFILGFFPPS